MTRNTYTPVVAGVSKVMSTQINPVYSELANVAISTMAADYKTATTASGNITLTNASEPIQSINCNGANRDVTLPTLSSSNHPFTIINRTASTYLITVKNSDGTVLVVIPVGSHAMLVSDGSSNWYVIMGGTSETLLGGWIPQSETWTYVDAKTFTVPGDRTAIYTKGRRIRWTQTTVKYGVIISSSFAAGITTVTICVNTDYVITNAAITLNSVSNLDNPENWPGWFNWTPVVTAQTGTITSYTVNSFKYYANKVGINIQTTITITTNGTGAGFILVTLPIAITSIMGYGREAAVSGNALQAYIISGTQFLIARYDGAYPAGNGYVLALNIFATW